VTRSAKSARLEGKAMSRQPHFQADRRVLARYDDVHRAFRHVGEVKLLEILALRPTAAGTSRTSSGCCAA
jgi:hypothetical protein